MEEVRFEVHPGDHDAGTRSFECATKNPTLFWRIGFRKVFDNLRVSQGYSLFFSKKSLFRTLNDIRPRSLSSWLSTLGE